MYPFTLYSCLCADAFRSCLSSLKDDDLARETERLFFDVLDMKCSVKTEYQVCEEFDRDDLLECKNGTVVKMISIRH